jgi:hypothetical protein
MGNKLFSEVTELTGLPEDLISEELKSLLESKGVEPEQLTLESLREALADYLTQVALEFEGEEMPALEGEVLLPPSKSPC